MPPQNKIFRAIVAINSIGFEICYGNYMIFPDRNGVRVRIKWNKVGNFWCLG